MKIGQYISELLYRHQCVIVPNLGAFITEKTSAKINDLTGIIIPPKKNIIFNSLLTQNDGLLVNHIAIALSISFEEALTLVENEIKNWHQSLNERQTIYLKNIGELTLNEAQKISFEPIGATNYLTSSFGLSPIIAKPISQVQNTTPSRVPKPSLEKSKSFKMPKWMGYTAASVIGLTVLGSVWKYHMDYSEYLTQSLEIEKEVQKGVEKEIQQATFYIEVPKIIEKTQEKIEEITVQKNEKAYHVVAGAFRTEARSSILVDELKNKGYENARFIQKEGSAMKNVIYNSFLTYQEAQVFLQEVIKNENPNAWILVVN